MISVMERTVVIPVILARVTSTFEVLNVNLITEFPLTFKLVLLYSETGLLKETQIK
jgi:hypothetical protein